MGSVKDDRGFNQGFTLVRSTEIRMRRRADWIMAEFDNIQGSVLEIGCGRGEVSFWLAEKMKGEVLGTDLCQPFIQHARDNFKLPNLSYEVLDFNNPQQVNGRTFDYIVGNGILHHLYYNLPQALLTIKGLLRPGGKLIFMEPNIYNPYCAVIFKIPFFRRMASLEPDEMAFSKGFISKKCAAAGFHSVSVSYRDFLLPGVPDVAIKPLIAIGNVLEKIPLLKTMSQSIFIVAKK